MKNDSKMITNVSNCPIFDIFLTSSNFKKVFVLYLKQFRYLIPKQMSIVSEQFFNQIIGPSLPSRKEREKIAVN